MVGGPGWGFTVLPSRGHTCPHPRPPQFILSFTGHPSEISEAEHVGTWAEGAQILPCSSHLSALDLGDVPGERGTGWKRTGWRCGGTHPVSGTPQHPGFSRLTGLSPGRLSDDQYRPQAPWWAFNKAYSDFLFMFPPNLHSQLEIINTAMQRVHSCQHRSD